jgi:hypothetical protein
MAYPWRMEHMITMTDFIVALILWLISLTIGVLGDKTPKLGGTK